MEDKSQLNPHREEFAHLLAKKFWNDYLEVLSRYTHAEKIEITEHLMLIFHLSKVDDNLMAYITTATKVLRDLPNYYENATLSTRQRLIGSMYPEKLVYENKSYRTTRINEAARVICNPDGLLEGLKKGQASEIGSLSEQVTRIGFEPMTPSLEGWCSIQLSYRAGNCWYLQYYYRKGGKSNDFYGYATWFPQGAARRL